MYFYYERYFLECLVLAMGILVFILSMLIRIAYCVLKLSLCNKLSRQDKIKSVYFSLFLLFFMCMVCGHLSHGGIYLIQEKQTEAVSMRGYITQIDELGIFLLPSIENDYNEDKQFGDPQGYEFTINGVQCTAPAKKSLMVGDYVEVEYLPKSGYILYIDKVEVE